MQSSATEEMALFSKHYLSKKGRCLCPPFFILARKKDYAPAIGVGVGKARFRHPYLYLMS